MVGEQQVNLWISLCKLFTHYRSRQTTPTIPYAHVKNMNGQVLSYIFGITAISIGIGLLWQLFKVIKDCYDTMFHRYREG